MACFFSCLFMDIKVYILTCRRGEEKKEKKRKREREKERKRKREKEREKEKEIYKKRFN